MEKEKSWAIRVNSIGSAGVGLVKALKEVSPLSENKIAARLFQAPAHLLDGLPRQFAEDMNKVLQDSGLDSEVVEQHTDFEAGDADHEVALVIRDVSRMDEIAKLTLSLTGAALNEVRQILFSSPCILLGKISKNTALRIRERFLPLGVEVDISNAHTARFDVFLGQCSEWDRVRVEKIFGELQIPLLTKAIDSEGSSIIASDLTRTQADKVWQKVSRTNLPLRIINRDFERFDLLLESLPDSAEAIKYLTDSTGMPDEIAHKALKSLPIVLHQNISFAGLQERLSEINRLGGTATGNLLVFQLFSLQLEAVKDRKKTVEILKGLGGVEDTGILEHPKAGIRIPGPFTSLQARLLQLELKRIGTDSKRILKP